MDTIKETIVEENTIKSTVLYECELLMVQYKKDDIRGLESITKAILTIVNNSLKSEKDEDHRETLKIMKARHEKELDLISKYIGFLKGDIKVSLSDSEVIKGVRYKPQMWSYSKEHIQIYEQLGLEEIKSYLS